MKLLKSSVCFATLAILFFSTVAGWGQNQSSAQPPTGTAERIIVGDKPFQFSYQAWENRVKVGNGRFTLEKLKSNGGAGTSAVMNLEAKADFTPALKLRVKPGNTAKRINLQLLDSNGVVARWEFPIPATSGDFSFVTVKGAASLSSPHQVEDKKHPDDFPVFNLAGIVQWQLLGDWQPTVLNLEIDGIWLLPPDAAIMAVRNAVARKLIDFNNPSRFAYQSWENKVKFDNGLIQLKNVTTSGGSGANENLKLLGRAEFFPAMKVRTGSGNTAKTLILELWDADGIGALWEFRLPPASAEFSVITHCASLAKPPYEQDKAKGTKVPSGSLDLSRIKGWQLRGNWQPGVFDLEIADVFLQPPASPTVRRQISASELAAQSKQRREQARIRRIEQERAELQRRYGVRGPQSPEVTHVGLVAPEIVQLTVEAQKVVLPRLERYVPQSGDDKKIEKWPDGVVRRARLIRDGKDIGWLQGLKLDWFSTHESLEGDPFLYFLADDPANYTISSADDPKYAEPVHPVAVFRKSAPMDWQMEHNRFPMRHQLYLKLKQPLASGKTYRIALAKLNVREPELLLACDSRQLRSDAVHANQIGYRPDDPAKLAFLSVWLGGGGTWAYPAVMRFSIIDEADGRDVFHGIVQLSFDASAATACPWNKVPKNDTGTAVYRMDFSEFRTPGRYRVHVEGIGCSYPFSIAADVWEKAFKIQMRGLFHNRSGVELGEPYTSFRKPRDFNPADGAVVTRSTYDVLTGGNEAFAEIVKGDTGEPVPEAWGGYHDAGDWNPRRVSHLSVTMAQLELVEMYPEYFKALKLNIPSTPGIPDLITEALFEIDCFRRLQRPDGGIPYGIETNGDPSPGEISWLSTMHAYVLAPNIRDSWQYAAAAARAAKVLKQIRPELASVYEASARKAFAWAESDYARRQSDGSLQKLKELWRAVDNRNLAALILYDLTGESVYHSVFLQDTMLKNADSEICWYGKGIQVDAAFLYARMNPAKTDPAIRKHAVAAIVKLARRSLEYASGNSFNIAQMDKWRPRFGGYYSVSGGTALAQAHYLTGDVEFLAGAVRSCQFQAGCNPNNLVYTTGLGIKPVRHPLHLDSRSSGQPPPEGLTTFGNVDYWNNKGGFWDWPISYISKPEICYPQPYDWPIDEAYFDIFLFVSMNEFVVDTWTPNVFVWGYLAARPRNIR